MFHIRHLFIVWMLCAARVSPSAAAQETKPLRAGAAVSDITPEIGVSINGGMQDRTATRIHDRLHARCVMIDDGTVTLGIVIADSCMIPREIFDEAKTIAFRETKVPGEHLLMAATHTHSAACVTGVFQSEPDIEYRRFLTKQIAKAVIKAYQNLAPAKIGWGSGSVPDEVFNRRWKMHPGSIGANPFGVLRDSVKMNPPRASADLVEPAGPVDPQVSVVGIASVDGAPIALLGNYSLHYVGGTGAGEISADYFGMFSDRIRELLQAEDVDPPFVAMLSNGTSGDINNIDFRKPIVARAPYEQMRAVADKVAAEAHRVWRSLVFHETLELSTARTELSLGVRLPSQADVESAREILEQADGDVLRGYEQIYARETVLLSEYPERVPVPLQALKIGDLAIAAIPCEVFVEIGLAIKKHSSLAQTFTIELANGYNGYLPTAAQHELGGYETWRARSSYLEVDAAEKILSETINLIEQLR